MSLEWVWQGIGVLAFVYLGAIIVFGVYFAAKFRYHQRVYASLVQPEETDPKCCGHDHV